MIVDVADIIDLSPNYSSKEIVRPVRERENPPTALKNRQLGLVGPAGLSANVKSYAELRTVPMPATANNTISNDEPPRSAETDTTTK